VHVRLRHTQWSINSLVGIGRWAFRGLAVTLDAAQQSLDGLDESRAWAVVYVTFSYLRVTLRWGRRSDISKLVKKLRGGWWRGYNVNYEYYKKNQDKRKLINKQYGFEMSISTPYDQVQTHITDDMIFSMMEDKDNING
jgi:hypothetical protein